MKTKNIKLLLVEDDAILALHLSELLKEHGYAVDKIVHTGEAAYDYMLHHAIDLILMDISLAGELTGIQAAKQILLHKSIPIIFITGNDSQKVIEEIQKMDLSWYMLKPIDEKELHAAIQIVFHRYILFQQKELASINKNKNQLNSILKNLTECIIVCDHELKIQYINPIALAYTGYHQKTAIGKNLFEVLHLQKENQPEQWRFDVASFKMQDSIMIDRSFRLVSKNTKTCDIEGSINSYKFEDGSKGVIVLFKDITEQLEAEKIKDRHKKLKKEMDALKSMLAEQKKRLPQQKGSSAQVNVPKTTKQADLLDKFGEKYIRLILSSVETGDDFYEIQAFCEEFHQNQFTIYDMLEIHMKSLTYFCDRTEQTDSVFIEILRSMIIKAIIILSEISFSNEDARPASEAYPLQLFEQGNPIHLEGTEQELDSFSEETEEQIQQLNNLIIQLDTASEKDPIIKESFRIAHTIKGNCASINHKRMVLLIHKIESIFDAFRSKAVPIDTDIINLILKASDSLPLLLEEVKTKQQGSAEVLSYLKSFDQYLKKTKAPVKKSTAPMQPISLSDIQKEAIHMSQLKGYRAYLIKLEVSESATIPSITLLSAYNELKLLGDIVITAPAETELDPESENRLGQLVLISKESRQAIENYTKAFLDIHWCNVEVYSTHSQNGKAKLDQTVKVNASVLKTMSFSLGDFAELNQKLYQNIETLEIKYPDEPLVDTLLHHQHNASSLVDSLEQQIAKMRMLDIRILFDRLPKIARSLAQKLDKKVQLILNTDDFSINKQVIDGLQDPLTHIIRNCMDHGIEPPNLRKQAGKNSTGTITLSAQKEGGSIIIKIADDGKGLPKQAIKEKIIQQNLLTESQVNRLSDEEIYHFIFRPGFSTAEKLSDVSGRGVGMDIVTTKIQSLNGRVKLHSEEGVGTKLTITLPDNILEGLVMSVSNSLYFLPLQYVIKLFQPSPEHIQSLLNKENVVQFNGQSVPVIDIDQFFHRTKNRSHTEIPRLLLAIKDASDYGCLIIDEVLAKRELVIHDLMENFKKIPGLLGTGILGDGKVIKILDVPKFFSSIKTQKVFHYDT